MLRKCCGFMTWLLQAERDREDVMLRRYSACFTSNPSPALCPCSPLSYYSFTLPTKCKAGTAEYALAERCGRGSGRQACASTSESEQEV